MFMTGSLGSAGVVGLREDARRVGGGVGGRDGGGSEGGWRMRGGGRGPGPLSLQLGHSPTKAKQANFPRTDYLPTQT